MKARVEKKVSVFEPYDLIISIESIEEEKSFKSILMYYETLHTGYVGGTTLNINAEMSKYLQDVINLKITK